MNSFHVKINESRVSTSFRMSSIQYVSYVWFIYHKSDIRNRNAWHMNEAKKKKNQETNRQPRYWKYWIRILNNYSKLGKEYVKAVLPAASTEDPTHDKVMWKRPDEQGSGLEGPPPWTWSSIYPQTRICLSYYFVSFTNSSDINRGLSLTTFLWRKST